MKQRCAGELPAVRKEVTMSIGIWHIIGIAAVLCIIAAVSLYSGKMVKSAADFTTGGGKIGRWMVCGTIMGSLVGGQATIGTAQLAFTYGMSAWWFTLGSGLGCLLLALVYALPLRNSGNTTLLQTISNEYGSKAGYLGSLFSSVGIFISVIAQVISAIALISTLFPVNTVLAALFSVALMALFVIFGGVWGAGMSGVVKLILLSVASMAGCIVAVMLSGGFGGMVAGLGSLLGGTALGGLQDLGSAGEIPGRFFSLLARGASKDIGSGLSLLLGVLSTQIYAQGVMSARSDKEGKTGALLAACLIPPIGAACIFIGMFMRNHYITTAEIAALAAIGEAVPAGLRELSSTAQAFPVFVVNHLPPLFSGIVLGTLFITILGGGSGLSLGAATILVNDVFKRLFTNLTDPVRVLKVTRLTIFGVLAAATAVALGVPGTVINDMGFLSMGLRGSVIFIPLTCALFLRGRLNPRFVFAAEVAGPIGVLVAKFTGMSVDPLFVGMAASFALCAVATAAGGKKEPLQ